MTQIDPKPKRYHQLKTRIFFLCFILDAALLVYFSLSGLSVHLRNFSAQYSSSLVIINGIYLFMLSLVFYLLRWPFNFFEGYYWEHRFRLSNQQFLPWAADDLKKAIIGFLFLLVLVEGIYLFLERFPHAWWIWAGGFWLLLSFGIARILPTMIIPLFYKYSPVADGQLKEIILGVFQKCKIRVQNVYTINFSEKSKKANAFICGLGKSRRVVLTDTLVSQFNIPEIETVVSHELGHHCHKDILKLTLVNAFVIFFGLFLIDKVLLKAIFFLNGKSLHDIAYLPVFALGMMIFGFISMPVLNWYSRKLEMQADRFALELTDKPDDFVSVMNKLGEMNLSEQQPSKFNEIWFYDHPPLAQRIAFARKFKPAMP